MVKPMITLMICRIKLLTNSIGKNTLGSVAILSKSEMLKYSYIMRFWILLIL